MIYKNAVKFRKIIQIFSLLLIMQMYAKLYFCLYINQVRRIIIFGRNILKSMFHIQVHNVKKLQILPNVF